MTAVEGMGWGEEEKETGRVLDQTTHSSSEGTVRTCTFTVGEMGTHGGSGALKLEQIILFRLWLRP